jgi:hypothetical protein
VQQERSVASKAAIANRNMMRIAFFKNQLKYAKGYFNLAQKSGDSEQIVAWLEQELVTGLSAAAFSNADNRVFECVSGKYLPDDESSCGQRFSPVELLLAQYRFDIKQQKQMAAKSQWARGSFFVSSASMATESDYQLTALKVVQNHIALLDVLVAAHYLTIEQCYDIIHAVVKQLGADFDSAVDNSK